MMHQMVDMFDQKKIAETVFNMAKDYTETTSQIMKTSMDQYEKTVDLMLKQGLVAQDEGKKLLTDWMNRAKQGQQDYLNMMNESLKKMESFFNPDGQKRSAK
jgi:polyhydroxyalkanoate synthesis regulator phasin